MFKFEVSMIRRAFILLITGALLCQGAHGQGFLPQVPEIRDLLTGATLTQEEAVAAPGVLGEWTGTLFGSPQAVTFVRVNPAVYMTDIICAEGEYADSTSALCSDYGAAAGINGSYFNMKELTPVTYVKDNGKIVGSATKKELFRVNGIFMSWPNRVAIEAADTTTFDPKIWEAIASGPILIDDGTVITYSEGIPEDDGFYNKRHPRSLIGTDAEGYIWLVVVDGRSAGNAEGMTIAELTELAGMIGLTDALNLDGGGSSTLWTQSAGVLNYPCDNGRFDHFGQRIVPNVIAVRKTALMKPSRADSYPRFP